MLYIMLNASRVSDCTSQSSALAVILECWRLHKYAIAIIQSAINHRASYCLIGAFQDVISTFEGGSWLTSPADLQSFRTQAESTVASKHNSFCVN